MAEFITRSRAETVALGERLAQRLAPGTLVCFTGGLGAGKTAFTEGLAAGLGCTDPVSSPTFIPAGASRVERVRKCCSARISVGAMRAV